MDFIFFLKKCRVTRDSVQQAFYDNKSGFRLAGLDPRVHTLYGYCYNFSRVSQIHDPFMGLKFSFIISKLCQPKDPWEMRRCKMISDIFIKLVESETEITSTSISISLFACISVFYWYRIHYTAAFSKYWSKVQFIDIYLNRNPSKISSYAMQIRRYFCAWTGCLQ